MAEWEAMKVAGKVVVASEDFGHDVWLYVSGDFEDDDEALTYAGRIADKLNSSAALASQEVVAWQWLDTANFRKQLPKAANRNEWRPLVVASSQSAEEA